MNPNSGRTLPNQPTGPPAFHPPSQTLPMVSVIIPVYNAEKYVAETVRSILQSDYRDIEVVCVDDGSTDRSAREVEAVAQTDSRVRLLRQENGGVCRARNAAIAASKGKYILPIDADDLVMPSFISSAVRILETSPEVKAVVPLTEFFGAKEGLWKLAPFSRRLLARKNMIPVSALYRRADFDRTRGYCEEIKAREDWEFWIQMLKDGGEVAYLTEISLRYRIHGNTKRVGDRKKKRHVVDVLNRLHPEFFERELGGPLHYRRSWSRWLNRLSGWVCPKKVHVEPGFEALRYFVATLPLHFQVLRDGEIIYSGRNELRAFDTKGVRMVVKSFCLPFFLNRIVYGWLRSSKAQRSCEYAAMLRRMGIDSPAPVGYCTTRRWGLFAQSYYASLESELPFTYIDLMEGRVEQPEAVLKEIGRLNAKLHEAGIIHTDFSRGNILIGTAADGTPHLQLVDLNRMRFRPVSFEEGCANFERLPATEAMKRALAAGYAEGRHRSTEEALALWPSTEAMDSVAAGKRAAK